MTAATCPSPPGPRSLVPRGTPAPPRVQNVVHALRAVACRAALDLALRVGQIVVQHFYGGNLHVWRQRGNRCPSLRRLARHPDLPFSAAALYRAVAIYELCSRLPDVATWKHVGASHLRTVLPLPAPDQERLLKSAEEEQWTVSALSTEVRELRRCVRGRRGRPPTPTVVRSIRLLVRSTPAFEPDTTREELRSLAPQVRAELRHELASLRRRFDTIERLLDDCGTGRPLQEPTTTENQSAAPTLPMEELPPSLTELDPASHGA